jgi:hypothetical protein
MENKRFDDLAKRVGTSRRSLLRKMVGLGGAAAMVGIGMSEAEAARRGQADPKTGLLRSTKFCTLTSPQCCLTCELYPWADLDDMLALWGHCYKQGANPDVCNKCQEELAGLWAKYGICY